MSDSGEGEGEEIRPLFDRWRAWVRTHCSDEVNQKAFVSVATMDSIAATERHLGCVFPADFKSFLLLCDGSHEEVVLPNYNSLLSLKEIADVHAAMVEAHDGLNEGVAVASDRIAPCGFHRRWIPVASECSGCSVTCIDLAPGPAGISGQVIRWWDEGCDVEFVAESFAAWLRRLVADLDGGRFHVDDDAIVAVNDPSTSPVWDGSFCAVC